MAHIFGTSISVYNEAHEELSGEFTESVIEAIQNCEVCPKANQPKEQFPILKERIESLFELVHADV